MPIVNVIFKPDATAEERGAALEEIRQLAGVTSASYLRPGAKNPVLQRMACARVADPAQAAPLAAQIEALGPVQTASLPSQRTLQGTAE